MLKFKTRLLSFFVISLLLCTPKEILCEILEANHSGRNFYLKTLLESPHKVLTGSFKLNSLTPPDKEIIKILESRTNRSKETVVILESRLTPEEIRGKYHLKEEEPLQTFQRTGCTLITDAFPYKNVHLKLLLTKDLALISTTNYDGVYDDSTARDFTAVIRDPSLLKELHIIWKQIQKNIPVNWSQYAYSVDDLKENETRLSWGPAHHKSHLLEIIQKAEHDISIYQQDLQDESITNALLDKLSKNVKVRILMSHYPFSSQHPNKSLPNLIKLAQAGAQIRLTGKKILNDGQPLHIHAKVLLIDKNKNSILYLGSANFFPPILDPNEKNLNLGIITRNLEDISFIKQYFQQDWENHASEELRVN